MKFLLDQDVYAATARFLRDLGHDVVTAAEIGCAQTSDRELLATAREQGRILITRDRDFGGLVFLGKLGSGVIYLRTTPSTLDAGHRELQRALDSYSEAELQRAFVTIEPSRHRFRRVVR